MADLANQGKTASKLIEFEMLQDIVEDDSKHESDYKLLFQGQGKILLALNDNDNLSQKDLVDLVNMTPQSTAEFIRKLEKKGFVTRKKSTADKRVTIVSLTEKGREEVQKRTRAIPEYLRVLSDTDLEQLNKILDKINNQMYQKINEADPTLHNKYHQFMLNRVLKKIHPDDPE